MGQFSFVDNAFIVRIGSVHCADRERPTYIRNVSLFWEITINDIKCCILENKDEYQNIKYHVDEWSTPYNIRVDDLPWPAAESHTINSTPTTQIQPPYTSTTPTFNIKIRYAAKNSRPGRWQAPSCQRSHRYSSGDFRLAGACSPRTKLKRIQNSRLPSPCRHCLFFIRRR